MANVLYVDGIEMLTGALDTVKEGQVNRARLVSRRNKRIDKWISPDGRLWHQLYVQHMHEGEWSPRVVQNREFFNIAHRISHDIEHICKHPEGADPELVVEAKEWEEGYAEYLKTFPKGSKEHKQFYGWMYTEVYQKVRREAGWD